VNKEVEILKLGSIMPTIKHNVKSPKETIMVVSDGGHIFDHYLSILRKELAGDYNFLKTTKMIVGGPFSYRPGNNDSRLIGKLDGDLVVGMSFAVGSWHSSIVQKIINKNIAITNNSVYVIHNLSDFRDKKLEDLGIK